MNVGVTATIPLAIIVFVSGVYCPRTVEYPSIYPLRRCTSNCSHIQLDTSGGTFEITKCEENPRKYCLIQKLPDGTSTRKCCFRKKELEIVSLKDAEIAMMIYPTNHPNNPRKMTCVFQRTTLARKFYKDMTRESPHERVLLLQASYLLKSDDTEVGTQLYIYASGFDNYITIEMEDVRNDPFFVFPTGAVSQIVRNDPTEISMYMNTITGEELHYKFGFANEMWASTFNELLHRLCRQVRVRRDQLDQRLYSDPTFRTLLNQVESIVLRQIARNGTVQFP